MENDDDMRRIMEPLLSVVLTHVGVNTSTPNLFVPHGHQTKVFFQNIRTALIAVKSLILKRWQNFFENSYLNALSTHEMYLRYVMFACDIEVRFHDNVFDKIIGVFALIINFNIETLINSWSNFCELSVDIFMVFYKSALKDTFNKQGGFEEFAEYLRKRNEYLAQENYHRNPLEVSNVLRTNKDLFLNNLYCKTEKEIEKAPYHPNLIKHCDVIGDDKCESLAKEVLSTTKRKLHPLPNSANLKIRLQAARQRRAATDVAVPTSKGETMTTGLKSGTTDKSLKSKTMTASSERETTSIRKASEAAFKHKPPQRLSKDKATHGDLERKVANTDLNKKDNTELKGKGTNTDFKEKGTNVDSKRKISNMDLKPKTTEKLLERETTEANLKRETTTDALIRKATNSAFKHEKTEIDTKQKLTNADSKQNAVVQGYKRKTAEPSSKRESSKETSLQWCVDSETDSQINNAVKDKMDLCWCENIVQRVIKYNDSKCSDPSNTNNQIQREADELLKQLKDKIKYLIDSLEK